MTQLLSQFSDRIIKLSVITSGLEELTHDKITLIGQIVPEFLFSYSSKIVNFDPDTHQW